MWEYCNWDRELKAIRGRACIDKLTAGFQLKRLENQLCLALSKGFGLGSKGEGGAEPEDE